MLRISRLTDYAVVLSTRLAEAGEPEAVSDLSRRTEIPAPTVSKVLKLLGKAGVVVSARGANGGYRLSRPAEAIPILEIISAIEGPIAVTECAEETSGCEHETHCGVRANWQRINHAVQAALAGISLADMAQGGSPGLVALHRSADAAEEHRRALRGVGAGRAGASALPTRSP